MPFDSNGVFSRIMNWTSDMQNGIAIECGRHDAEDNNFAEGFNDTFCRDGRAAATGNFDLGNHKIQKLASGTATTDAVNKGQLDTVADSVSTLDGNVVHLAGAETITGAKTFENQLNVRMPSDAFGYRAQNTSVARGTTPANIVNYQWVAQGNDGLDINHRLGGMYVYYRTDGGINTDLVAYKPEAYNETTNPNINSIIRIAYPKTGSPYTYAPNPSLPSSASGYTGQIVTVGYLEGNSSGVVHKTGNETINGDKTFISHIKEQLNNPYLVMGNTSLTKGTVPQETHNFALSFCDTNTTTSASYAFGRVETQVQTDKVVTYLRAYKNAAGTDNTGIAAVYPNSGDPYALAPTPSASVVGNEIITAKWYVPNYSKATNKSAETKYTPTKDVRVIIAGTIQNSGNNGSMEARVQINDADKFTLYGGYVYGYNEDPFFVAFDVKAGDSYKLYKVSGTLTVKQFIEIPYGG